MGKSDGRRQRRNGPGYKNLNNILDRALYSEWDEASTYYQHMQTLLVDIAVRMDLYRLPAGPHSIRTILTYETMLDRICGAFSALSPNLDETGNLISLAQVADHVLSGLPDSGLKTRGYPLNRLKAVRILRGEPVLGVLRGTKVVAFYYCIRNPRKATNVVVDGHVWNAYRNQVVPLRGKAATINTAQYAEVAETIVDLATERELPPPTVQAVIWLAWKRINGILPRKQQMVLPGLGRMTGPLWVKLARMGY